MRCVDRLPDGQHAETQYKLRYQSRHLTDEVPRFEKRLADKRRQEDRRVVLHPVAEAEDRRAAIAPPPPADLAIENRTLGRQVERLTRRVTDLLEENRRLDERLSIWRQRAFEAGWTEPVAALVDPFRAGSSGSG